MSVFRPLAESGSHQAPEHVELAVRDAFRSYHRARRIRRRLIAGMATAAVAAGAAAVVILAPVQVDPPDPVPSVVLVQPVPPAIAWVKSRQPPQSVAVHKPALRPRTDRVATTEFVALPYGDDSLVEESATIVRVELQRSALRLAGFTVAQEHANDRIQADVVLGADGLAHAVRFVKYLE